MTITGNLKHLKRCKSCGEEKTYDEFYKQPTGRFGRNARCKKCKIKEQRGYDEEFRANGKTKGCQNLTDWLISGNVVYQFIKGDKVIYCGQTVDFYGRMSQHRHASSFYSIADKLRVSQFPSRLSMHIAEAMLIAKLQPCFNNHIQDGDCDFAKLPDIEWKEVTIYPTSRQKRKAKLFA